MNDKFTKDIECPERYQTEIFEIKSHTEFINCRNDQREDRVSENEDKMITYEVLREATKEENMKRPSSSS